MEKDCNYHPGKRPCPSTFSRPRSPSLVGYKTSGGIRHGFSTGSIMSRTYPYHPLANSAATRLLPPPHQVAIGPPLDNRTEEEDYQMASMTNMATPFPSQRPSGEIIGMPSSIMHQNRDHICSRCDLDPRYTQPTRNSFPGVNPARAAYNAASQYRRLLVNDLLNSPPSDNRYSNENQNSGVNNASANLPEPGRARTISSSSAMSINSSGTISFDIAEERVFLLGTLYYTCLDASTSHSRSLPPISAIQRPRTTSSSRRRRHHPYDQHSRPGYQARQRTAGRPRSLMDSISAICSHMWRRARSDALARHRAEAEAVRAMRDLYAWAEIIVRGFQNDDLEDMMMECGSSMKSVGGNDVWVRVGEAAMNLCGWLGDDEALEVCEGVVDELRELKEKEDGSVNSDEFDGIF